MSVHLDLLCLKMTSGSFLYLYIVIMARYYIYSNDYITTCYLRFIMTGVLTCLDRRRSWLPSHPFALPLRSEFHFYRAIDTVTILVYKPFELYEPKKICIQ